MGDCKHGSWIKKLKIIIKTAKNYESVTRYQYCEWYNAAVFELYICKVAARFADSFVQLYMYRSHRVKFWRQSY